MDAGFWLVMLKWFNETAWSRRVEMLEELAFYHEEHEEHEGKKNCFCPS